MSGPTPVNLARLPRGGVLLGLTITQVATLGVGLVPLLVGIYSGTPLWALPFTGLCTVVALVPVGGRHLVGWAPIVAVRAWRSATGQTEHRTRIARPRPAGTLALPGAAAALRQVVDPVTGAAFVHDPHAATLTAVVPVTHQAFGLLDPDDQARRVATWGRILAGLGRSGRIAALQVTERTLPTSGAGLADWFASHATDDGGLAATLYRELVDRAGPLAERHSTTVALVLDLRSARGRTLAAGVEALRQEVATLATALRAADVVPGTPLTPGDLAVLLRTAYDPTVTAALERHGDLGRDLATAGPVAVEERWGHLRADGSFHVVLWITQWPQSAVHPGFLAPLLLAPGVRRTLSLRYEPVPAVEAIRSLRRARTGHLADAAQRAGRGQTDGAVDAAEHADVLTQEAELAAGHALLRATGLLIVSAESPDGLERDVAVVEQAAAQAGCETRRLWGQQAAAFARAIGV